MHLSGISGDARYDVGGKLRGAADAVLGTGAASADSVYDMRSGTLLTFVLLFIIGWVPVLGQMVAGYVGGRRSGSPVRGFVSTGIATFGAVVILLVISMTIASVNGALANDPEVQIATISESSPLFGQVLSLGLTYTEGLFGTTNGLEINFAVYVLAVVFGIIGGVVADQSKKEIRLIIASAGNVPARRTRSIEMYKMGKSLGFESFEDYSVLAVNSMAAVQKQAPVVREVEIKTAPVTATVDLAPKTNLTPTSDKHESPFATILSKPSADHKVVADSDEKPKEEFDFV